MDQAIQRSPFRSPPQFTLKRLFVLTAIVAAVFGAIHWLGLGLALAVLVVSLAIAGGYALPGPDSAKWPAGFAAGILSMTLVAMLLPGFQGPSCTASRRSQCWNNLRQIGLGLQNYADAYGCFPPAYLVDDNGRPMHSWRVLILPFVEEEATYKLYDFSEPWNGPHNRLLAKRMPPCYHCASDGPRGSGQSSYLAITGAETAWSGATGVTFPMFKDGTSNTVAVVEVAASGINWMEPRDLPFDALSKGVNPAVGLGISSRHGDAATIVFFDGHAGYLSNTELPATLRALATCAGGEVIVGY
jgi:prepilin-type processing-associated H-X9-DG protein